MSHAVDLRHALHPLRLTPTAVVSRLLPGGVPALREEALARLGLFGSALDPDATPGDPGLFGPDSATWRLVGQPAQALAGLRAALLQALSPPIPTATHSTGTFASDLLGRVRRTGAFVQAQNLGSMDEVLRSARRVRAMHRTVAGTWSDGTRFDAGDPHQQAWVSMTLTDSILAMVERFGSGPVPGPLADRFVHEQSTHGALLDPRLDLAALAADHEQLAALRAGRLPLPLIEEGSLPTTRAGLRDRMRDRAGELAVTPLTRSLVDAAVGLVGVPSPQRELLRTFVLAVLWTVPDPLHDLLAPDGSRLAELAAAQAVQVPMALLQATYGTTGPAVVAARARVAAG